MNAAPQLMVRRGRLNQALNKKTPRLGVASPNSFPRFMRLPKFARIEKRETFAQVVAVFFTEPRREPGGLRGRGAQLVPRPGRVR